LAAIPLMLSLVVLALAIPFTTNLVKQNQDNRSSAAGGDNFNIKDFTDEGVGPGSEKCVAKGGACVGNIGAKNGGWCAVKDGVGGFIQTGLCLGQYKDTATCCVVPHYKNNCSYEEDCKEGYWCDNGTCVYSGEIYGELCQKNSDCGKGLKCVDLSKYEMWGGKYCVATNGSHVCISEGAWCQGKSVMECDSDGAIIKIKDCPDKCIKNPSTSLDGSVCLGDLKKEDFIQDDECKNKGGTCQYTDMQCNGNYTSGDCPRSSSNVKCCVPTSTKKPTPTPKPTCKSKGGTCFGNAATCRSEGGIVVSGVSGCTGTVCCKM
jgi:hypothetical protein